MKQVVDVGLPPLKQAFSWAVKAKGEMLFMVNGPVRPDGSIDTGSIEQQARLTFANMQRATQAAGGSLENVTQVLIYMTDVADMDIIDKVYREFFSAPFPNRASVGVAALVEPGMKLEVVAYAMIP
ncbi:RidA family protein [Alcaligenes faecalis]|jgi:enamine deaminase RidA (YjgF/YER057c/UK114 family)|uniref:RidA family protein n=2 Tax=Alcaligenes faecalis TaxID=511 RepID=A0A2U2BJB3_ALCFA|nr:MULTISPECIES: RidA family protein [Alcaligenes]MBX6962703.1 RidA family protein [Providencia rettgeri]ALO38906.1 enamine deaminase RidA [Alcaligenes faecalis]KAA1286093.1 RidA family protein [Alcaligenes faecalis]MBQ0217038.1 RidA family protein [Alcaligenes faecalis]MBW4787128.1 RidA family protein [Alcaligenes faecalis subsp. faecalis]